MEEPAPVVESVPPEPEPATEDDEGFFARLPEVTRFDDVVRSSDYVDVPESWHVVITDVHGSTQAIERGRYREVNALGVASIIAVKNALPDVDVPFVFGGDGATLLVPSTRVEAVDRALRGAKELARTAFELELRVARVPISELKAKGHPVRVERYRLSPYVALAMFSGSGLQVAEGWVKGPESSRRYAVADGPADADFEGFQCRWQPMPSQRGEIVSLLVVALGPSEAAREASYAMALEKLNEVIGEQQAAPVSLRALRMHGVFGDYSIEAKLLTQQASGVEFKAARSFARKKTFIARTLMAVGKEAGGFDGRSYREEFIQNSDFRKFDETLRLVLDLSKDESAEVERCLDGWYAERRLAYGMHRSKAALATCMVKSFREDHVHFIDGADGGYALAARALKARLAAL